MRQYRILDIQGRLLARFHGSNDKSLTGEDGKSFSCWEAAMEDFLHDFLLPILEQGARPMDLIAVWDKGNTHRLNIDSTYKEKRRLAEKDPILKAEVTKLFEEAQTFLAYIGVKSVWVPGEEADDVIAMLCQKLEGAKVVYTGDKDLLQLVSDDTSVNYNREFHSVGFSTHAHPLGVPYKLTSFYKALVGDSSDGFGGVPNFGPKAFEKLFAQYGEAGLLWMQDVIDRDAPQDLKPYADADPVVKKIYDNWPHTRKGWKLASLAPQACYGVYKAKPKRPEWRVRVPNKDRVRRLLGEVYSVTAGATEDAALDHAMERLEKYFPTETLLTAADAAILPAVMSEVLSSPVVAYDFESSDKLQHPEFRKASGSKDYVDVLSQELAGLSINYGQHSEKTVYVPFDHKDTPNFSKDWAIWILQTLSSREEPTVVQNASFELSVSLANLGYMPAAPMDTQIMASYVDENEEAHLKGMSQRVLNYSQLSYRETTQGRAMYELTGQEVLKYGCDDSLVTTHLFDLYRMIMELEGSWAFYRDNEAEPAVDDAYSFVTGTVLDFERLAVLRKESAERLEKAEARVREELAKHVYNDEARVTRGAQTLLSEMWVTERFKVADDQAKAQAKYAELWAKAWALSCYTPMVETAQPAKVFQPTLGMINTVLNLIDPLAPRLTKLTQQALVDFDTAIIKYLSTKSLNDPQARELEAFVASLFAARKDLGSGKRNTPAYHEFAALAQGVIDREMKPVVKRSGTLLNFGSPQQMQAMLYSLLELPIRRRTKKAQGSLREREKLVGSPATGIKAIATALAFDVPEGDWRRPVLEDYKVVSTEQQKESLYFSKWPLWPHPKDGRVHPAIRNCGTVTRRPAGTNLNVLQVSKGDLRTAFKPGKGRVIVSLDFANQELVVTACESRDPVMLDAFMSTPRKDIHTVTSLSYAHMLLPRLGGPEISSITYDEFYSNLHSKDKHVSAPFKALRNKYSKGVNFLISYLGGYNTLAENLSIHPDLAKDLMNKTFALYAGMKPWQNEVIEFARRNGYSQTAYGTRRHVTKDIHSSDDGVRKRMERQAVNAVIQGGSADILKVVRQEMMRRDMRQRYQMEAVYPVYDELTASVPIELALDYAFEMKEIMEVTPPGYPVGMATELSIGPTWGSQEELIWDREKIETYLSTLEM
jgi:DNA polymerase I-like protein with 3'-5' exonuclease and polymerase domains/5'-3' exonuclease